MESEKMLALLNAHYPIHFVKIEPLREGGNATFAAYADRGKYFLKFVGAAFSDTFRISADVNLYLQQKGFSVPRIVTASDGRPYIKEGPEYLILYEFLDSTEIDPEKDAEEIGRLIGRLHAAMKGYPGKLITRGRAFYLDRYIKILGAKGYPGAGEFERYGEALWRRIESLPLRYSHGDMYSGNIARGADGKLYVLDFDTSAIGFPTYDLALIANQTDYFKYLDDGLARTAAVYGRMLPEYLKFQTLSPREADSIYDMLALYHFALQATIIEIYGIDCVDHAFFDRQLDWLKKWRNQCEARCERA